MPPAFVHLHVHTEYSLAERYCAHEAAGERPARRVMPAVAVTDQSNLFAMVKFYRAAMTRA